MKALLKNIFSIRNEYHSGKKYKIITILFLKIKFKVFINIKSMIESGKLLEEFKPKKIDNLKIISSTKNNKFNNKKCTAICAVYKNEPDIKEWIEYHKLIGFDKFYLYDNESTDNSFEILRPYIDDGTVIYHYLPGKCKQLLAYRDAVKRYKKQTQWLAIIDLDEYICPVEHNNIKDFLISYKKAPAVGINWVVFDSNGYIQRPNKLVIEAYSRVLQNCNEYWINHHIKSIVQPNKVKYITNPHYCIYKNNKTAMDENFNPIGNSQNLYNSNNAFTSYNSVQRIRINHYHTKSEEDYNVKISIGYADHIGERPKVDKTLIFNEDTVNDYVIQKYLPKLKEKMRVEV